MKREGGRQARPRVRVEWLDGVGWMWEREKGLDFLRVRGWDLDLEGLEDLDGEMEVGFEGEGLVSLEGVRVRAFGGGDGGLVGGGGVGG